MLIRGTLHLRAQQMNLCDEALKERGAECTSLPFSVPGEQRQQKKKSGKKDFFQRIQSSQ